MPFSYRVSIFHALITVYLILSIVCRKEREKGKEEGSKCALKHAHKYEH